MKLIIDCGSTKADWVIIDKENVVAKSQSEGFNPNYTDKNIISRIVLNNIFYISYIQDITDVVFYGSGCGNEDNSKLIKDIFSSAFKSADVVVYADTMAACHALFGNQNGVACILGTGSNACLYDGDKIVDKMVSLGFIVGDEGSGSHIGKTLLHDYFYKIMPEDLSRKFLDEYKIDVNSFINNVYHKGQASRYIASFTKFAVDNKNHDYITKLCNKCFDAFIDSFILHFKDITDKEISFVGSVAYYFQDIISQRIKEKGFKFGKIMKSPIEGLIKFHSQSL